MRIRRNFWTTFLMLSAWFPCTDKLAIELKVHFCLSWLNIFCFLKFLISFDEQVVVWPFSVTSAVPKMARTPFHVTYSSRRQCGANLKSNVPRHLPTCAGKRLPTTMTGASQVNFYKNPFPHIVVWTICCNVRASHFDGVWNSVPHWRVIPLT